MLPLDGIGYDDLNQWLNRGWFVQIHEEGEVPVFFHGVDGPHITGMDVLGRIRSADRVRCFAHWPRCGAVNLPRFAVFVDRTPQRQYRRTYNSRCLELVIPRKWELMKLYGAEVSTMTPDSVPVVTACFDPQYPTFDDACQQVLSGAAFSRAINPYMIITLADSGRLIVYHRGDCVGWIEGTKFVPSIQSPQLARRFNKMFNGRVVTCESSH